MQTRDPKELERWQHAADLIDAEFAGKERPCPDCGNRFVSKFNRGKCPECGKMFFASNPACGSNSWLRVPDHALVADPIKYACPETHFFGVNLDDLPRSDRDFANQLLNSRSDDLDRVDESNLESPIDSRHAFAQILSDTMDPTAIRAFDVYVGVLEIICDHSGTFLNPDEMRFLVWSELPFDTRVLHSALPFTGFNAITFDRMAFLTRSLINDELHLLGNAEPKLRGSNTVSPWLTEQFAQYESILREAKALDLDVFSFHV
ncbi:hypothetical protein SH528x_004950 [Novipirellula sp. SH528]|uniref:hypothetical protein n=1 Tax=Novipirellula sp. SH528 TaxID=3454466 RepID=UPI003F9F91C1